MRDSSLSSAAADDEMSPLFVAEDEEPTKRRKA
jgi:hypothetical protein